MIKIDLHTHSTDSSDGGLNEKDYLKLLEDGRLDVIAVTDHDSIALAQELAKKPAFNNCLIIGQEIMTERGEIIGLYLTAQIEDGLPLRDAVQQIKKQGGFILVPHPIDSTRRSSLSLEDMSEIASDIDAVEIFNGRSSPKYADAIKAWVKLNACQGVASSDAHSLIGAGRTFTMVTSAPSTAEQLRAELGENSRPVFERPPLRALLAPQYNRLKNLIRIK